MQCGGHVSWQLQEVDVDIGSTLQAFVNDIDHFYVGATCVVPRRWLGGVTPGGRTIPGHCERWRRMVVVAVRWGVAGAALEAELVDFCRRHYQVGTLANKIGGGGGLDSFAWNFVYVCLDFVRWN